MDNNSTPSHDNQNTNSMNIIYLLPIIFSAIFGFVSFLPILGFPSFFAIEGYEYINLFQILYSSSTTKIKAPLIILIIIWCSLILHSIKGIRLFADKNNTETRYILRKFNINNYISFIIIPAVFFCGSIFGAIWLFSNFNIPFFSGLFINGSNIEGNFCLSLIIILITFFPGLIYCEVWKILAKKKKAAPVEPNTISSRTAMLIYLLVHLVPMLITSIVFMKNVQSYNSYYKCGVGSIIWIASIVVFIIVGLFYIYLNKSTSNTKTVENRKIKFGILTFTQMEVLLLLITFGLFLFCHFDPIGTHYYEKNIESIEIGMKKSEVESILGAATGKNEEDTKWVYYTGEFKKDYNNYIKYINNEDASLMGALEIYSSLKDTVHTHTEIRFVNDCVSWVIHHKNHKYSESDDDLKYISSSGELYLLETKEKAEALDAIQTSDKTKITISLNDYYYRSELEDGGFILKRLTAVPTIEKENDEFFVYWDDYITTVKTKMDLNISTLDDDGLFSIADGTKRITSSLINPVAASIKSISIPQSVESISNTAFNKCTHILENKDGLLYADDWIIGVQSSITSAIISSNTDGIADYAFEGCEKLSTLKIASDYKKVPIINMVISGGIIRIPQGAFKDCTSLKEVTISGLVEHIGNSAFENCKSLESVVVAKKGSTTSEALLGTIDLISIGDRAFYNCVSLVDFGPQGPLPSLGQIEQFIPSEKSCKISMPSNVRTIGDYAFYGCKEIVKVDLSDSAVETIGEYAFDSLSYLKEVYLPNSVTEIGSDAFYYNRKINPPTIYCEGNSIPEWNEKRFFTVIFNHKNG